MILIGIHSDQGGIHEVKVSGHAGWDDKGKDLVCAGISSIMTGALNALDELFAQDCDLEMKNNQMRILVKRNSENLQFCLRFLQYQLETTAEQFPEFVTIEQKEV